MKKYKIILVTILMALTFFYSLPVLAVDDYGIENTANQTSLENSRLSTLSIPEIVGDIIGYGLGFIGIIFFAIIFYAGIIWMLALGKSERAERAKDLLEKALIGLLIVFASYAVSRLVITLLIKK